MRSEVEAKGITRAVLAGSTHQAGPNAYEAAVVKRADGGTTGAGWPSVKQVVNRHCQAIAADLISLAGHSRWAAQIGRAHV